MLGTWWCLWGRPTLPTTTWDTSSSSARRTTSNGGWWLWSWGWSWRMISLFIISNILKDDRNKNWFSCFHNIVESSLFRYLTKIYVRIHEIWNTKHTQAIIDSVLYSSYWLGLSTESGHDCLKTFITLLNLYSSFKKKIYYTFRIIRIKSGLISFDKLLFLYPYFFRNEFLFFLVYIRLSWGVSVLFLKLLEASREKKINEEEMRGIHTWR